MPVIQLILVILPRGAPFSTDRAQVSLVSHYLVPGCPACLAHISLSLGISVYSVSSTTLCVQRNRYYQKEKLKRTTHTVRLAPADVPTCMVNALPCSTVCPASPGGLTPLGLLMITLPNGFPILSVTGERQRWYSTLARSLVWSLGTYYVGRGARYKGIQGPKSKTRVAFLQHTGTALFNPQHYSRATRIPCS